MHGDPANRTKRLLFFLILLCSLLFFGRLGGTDGVIIMSDFWIILLKLQVFQVCL